MSCHWLHLQPLVQVTNINKVNEDLGLPEQRPVQQRPMKVVKLVNKFSGGEEFNDAQECKRGKNRNWPDRSGLTQTITAAHYRRK